MSENSLSVTAYVKKCEVCWNWIFIFLQRIFDLQMKQNNYEINNASLIPIVGQRTQTYTFFQVQLNRAKLMYYQTNICNL